MKLQEIYDNIIQFGIQNDPRGSEGVAKELEASKKEYERIHEKDKPFFDLERLKNPYNDTRILCGEPQSEIKAVLSGIDIEVGEVLLADRLKEKGRKIDAIISHHPEGMALASLYQVMKLQSDLFNQFGVSITVAERLLEERMQEVSFKLLPVNHNRAVMAAQLLDIPFLCCHTPADNSVTTFLKKFFDLKDPYFVSDIIDILMELPEYKQQTHYNAGPKILIGKENMRCGKIFIDMTGGTSGPKSIYQRLAQEGLGTIIGMHMNEEHKKEAEKSHINVVIAGHISSDSLGMNLIIDHLCKSNPLEVIPCSGFIRHSRI